MKKERNTIELKKQLLLIREFINLQFNSSQEGLHQ